MRRGSGLYRDERLASASPSPSGAGELADATATRSGGTGGLSLRDKPSAWELLTDSGSEVPMASQMTQLVDQLENSPAGRRGQVAGALAELRNALQQVGHQQDCSDELSLPVGTVVVIAHTFLRHQP